MPSSNQHRSAEVDAWIAGFDHRQRPTITALRDLMLRVDAAVQEGIKWNAPSFRTTEWFATVNLRTKAGAGRAASPVAIVLHLGARKQDRAQPRIDDPDGLLEWLGPDRAMLVFASAADVRRRAAALRKLLEQWLRCVP